MCKLVKRKHRIYDVQMNGKVIGTITEREDYFLWRTTTKSGRATGQDEAFEEVKRHGS